MLNVYTRYNTNADTELTTIRNIINNAAAFAVFIFFVSFMIIMFFFLFFNYYILLEIYSAISCVDAVPPRSGVTTFPSWITSTMIFSIFLADSDSPR